MSFYDDASLVFLPSGQAGKDGKAYSMKPTNGDGDFTFSRGSNLTATRVDSNGLIEKGRENLLLQSNQFDTTWTTSSSSVTSGQSGYDGSSDAWLLSKSAANGRIYQNASVSGVATYSIYAKAGTTDWLYIIGSAGIYPEGYFDLSNGVLGSVSTNPSFIGANIQDVGNGWYRCSITFNTSLTRLWIYPADGNNDTSGTSGSIYIQDAQLEIGLTSTEYIESGATKGKAGILEHSPRFDYSGGASCPSLLLEGSRTNLVEYSEYFEDTSWWFQTNADVELSDKTSPEGVKNAYRVTYGEGGNRLGGAEFSLSNTPHTSSIYMRKVSGSGVVNFANQLGESNNITLTTDWERYDVTATLVDGTARLYIYLQTLGDVIEVYGAQLEEGSYPTSYIPNHSGGSVTREAESINSTGFQSNGIVGATDNYTIFFDISNDEANTASSGNSQWLKGRNSLDFNIWTLRKNDVADQKKHSLYFNEDSSFVFNNQTINKACFIFTSSEIKVFLDGSLNTTYSVTNSPLGLDDFLISYGSSDRTNIVLSQFLIFPEALSDPECITLTS